MCGFPRINTSSMIPQASLCSRMGELWPFRYLPDTIASFLNETERRKLKLKQEETKVVMGMPPIGLEWRNVPG